MQKENREKPEPFTATESNARWTREEADLKFDSNSIPEGFFIGRDVAEGRSEERKIHNSTEKRTKPEMGNTFSPVPEVENLELADIIDARAIKSLMDDFNKLIHITFALVDLKGNILVSSGWQDICTRFHRVHPETCKHCIESDTKLSAGVLPGQFKLYRCRNNMWDIATPIMVGGHHIGNIFSGQFFFEDEYVDYGFFRSQARKYGFNEEEYMAALEKVPRLSRESVEAGMTFLTKLAHMISQLSYSNTRLAHSLVERDSFVNALRESERRYRNIIETASEGILIIDSEVRISYANKKIAEMLGYSLEELTGKFLWDFADEIGRSILKQNLKKRRQGINEVYELKLICKDGSPLWALISPKALFDKEGGFTGSLGMFTDITERKQEECRINRYNLILEGINRIFRNVVQAKTEEELGNTCLSVALEVTGSQFGFINEIGTDGLLHDIAKSELAWERCLIYDKTGHQRLPRDFAVHGLYGSVISNREGFFTNDPPSHPDSIGLPQGHPPLKSFLGVPLVQEGKTVGLIAVANREGGYTCEQQKDLEAIAPAVVQALQRRKAEEALRLSNIYNRSLIEASLDPSVTIGRDGKIKDVNGATEQVTGYSRNYLIGTDFSYYFTEPEKAYTGYQQVFIDGKVRDYPLEIQHKDGQVTPVLYNASVYRDENGEVIGVFAAARDITERKKAEEALKKAYDNLEEIIEERTAQLEQAYNSLKESEEGLSEAQRMAHIGNWEWDIETDKAYWSGEMYRIFGRDPGKRAPSCSEYFNYIHPGDRDKYCDAIRKAVKGKPFGIDYRIVPDNGEKRIVHMNLKFVTDHKNIPVKFKGTVQDITERKKSEEKLQVLANVVKSSNDAIGTISLDDIITSWNEEAEQVYGYSAEEVLGKHTSILAPPHLNTETKELSELIKQGKKIHHYETSRVRKNGQTIYVSITLSPVFDTYGKLTAISFISRDITERKRVEEKLRESEEKYRNIVETANEGIFIINAETIITYANKKMTDMLRCPLEEVTGRKMCDFVSEESKDIVKLNQKRRRQGINDSYELKLVCKDGSSLWALVNAKSLFDKDGKFMGSISLLTDITKRKEAEEALANIEVARKKEIHHRIKNNLQVISSLLDLQAEKFNNREDIKDLEVLSAFRESQDRVKSMALIHEELYRGGGLDTLNFSSYIEELVENLFRTYRLGNDNLRLNVTLEENIFFDMDTAVPLGIIVNELVSNSLKHAFTGNEGEIRIRFCREEKNDKTQESLFSLTISDNGKGIPDNIELENPGTLGLKLVGILVDQLDGNLELGRGQGTEFRISFRVLEKS